MLSTCSSMAHRTISSQGSRPSLSSKLVATRRSTVARSAFHMGGSSSDLTSLARVIGTGIALVAGAIWLQKEQQQEEVSIFQGLELGRRVMGASFGRCAALPARQRVCGAGERPGHRFATATPCLLHAYVESRSRANWRLCLILCALHAASSHLASSPTPNPPTPTPKTHRSAWSPPTASHAPPATAVDLKPAPAHGGRTGMWAAAAAGRRATCSAAAAAAAARRCPSRCPSLCNSNRRRGTDCRKYTVCTAA